eukprot:1051708-Prorocentrum_minimum.AAC.7
MSRTCPEPSGVVGTCSVVSMNGACSRVAVSQFERPAPAAEGDPLPLKAACPWARGGSAAMRVTVTRVSPASLPLFGVRPLDLGSLPRRMHIWSI